jgi:UPF0176 protein
VQKILLYYLFTPLQDPEAIRLWQRALCEQLHLKGRILIADHGINGTVGGELADLKAYIAATKRYPSFKAIHFKWSDGARDHFPKLIVKVRPEIVTFGVPDKLRADSNGLQGGGTHIKPEAVHRLLKERGSDVVFFDGRNDYEAAVGKFKNAVVSAASHSRDFAKELEDPKYDALKDKTVITYCTGGIRCEVLTVLMKENGFQDVYQIDGGIAQYGEAYGDDGLWEGALYVFDGRTSLKFSDKAKDIGSCTFCHKKTSHYMDCSNSACNKLLVACQQCQQQQYCPECLNLSNVQRKTGASYSAEVGKKPSSTSRPVSVTSIPQKN